MTDKVHLQDNGEWEKGRLTQLWADYLRRSSSDVSEQDLKAKLFDHVSFYVDLLKNNQATGEELKPQLVESVRDKLTRVGSAKAYYDKFVTVLMDQKYDENGDATPDNLQYPPITLQTIFSDRPEVLARVKSQSREGRQRRVGQGQGPYTYKGHEQVLASLENGPSELEREKWVVPLTSEEEKQGERIKRELERVRQDYDTEYITQWVNFFRDVDVQVPANNKEAIGEFKVLSTPDWPYQRLLRTLADNTQFDEVAEKSEAEGVLFADGGVLDQIKRRTQQKRRRQAPDEHEQAARRPGRQGRARRSGPGEVPLHGALRRAPAAAQGPRTARPPAIPRRSSSAPTSASSRISPARWATSRTGPPSPTPRRRPTSSRTPSRRRRPSSSRWTRPARS